MKKIKGFTLVELIGVITVLGVILLITMPVVTGIVRKSKEQAYQKQVDIIERVAKEWGSENTEKLPLVLDKVRVTIPLETLMSSGKIQNSSIIDPRSKEEMTGCVIVNYNVDYNQYEYNYVSDVSKCVLYGDVNDDGKLTLADLDLLMDYINGWDVEINEAAADIYHDNKINGKDYAVLIQTINLHNGSVLYGDVNDDGKINLEDCNLLMDYINGWDVEINEAAADIYHDNKINGKDYAALMQMLYLDMDSILYGDVNDDGKINLEDCNLLMNYLNRWDVEIHEAAADVYYDNQINNKDYAALKQYIAGWEIELGY